MPKSFSTIYVGMVLFIVAIVAISANLTSLDFKNADAQKATKFVVKNENVDENNKLVVMSKVNIENLSKTGIIKVVGEINGEDFIKNIPLDTIKEYAKKIQVRFEMNQDNNLNIAHKPDEFFVCAYHFTNSSNYADDKVEPILNNFDCNEGDIQSTSATTKTSLFKPHSLVNDKTNYYYYMHSNPQMTSFATIEDGDTVESKTSNNKVFNAINKNIDNSDNNKPVKVKIIVPMKDKKDATKIKIMAMLKGQFKSEIVDVQKELKKNGDSTITRTFKFDRNTDMGPIQIGDRFHACVIGKDLYPPEGSECEKRLIKSLDRPNPLAAR
ncbi:MAG TPA: hypothetical protein VFK40_06895 [Nitrososphaeraceae archaeon]|nr:hypothetical protein [Nitrososphaeraceae archaeon]